MVTDGLDAGALLTHLTDQPAHALGSSWGAIVALELLRTRPELVRTLAAHDHRRPPCCPTPRSGRPSWTAPRAEQDRGHARGHGGIRRGNRPAGRGAAGRAVAAGSRRHGGQDPAEPLVLGIGRESRGTFPGFPNAALAKELGLELVEFPGDHIGYRSAPDGFAARLYDILTGDDH
ncbi:alpha/beta hydrolase [Nocardia beijingensis]|uniref:alpha/beta fold hydrolase n=1 Tax=Nocardia beijingensis TaxID=95162 RepID=UPI0018951C20|nr:alpha/beta hydrolase [Nocardia beijingensis]MBF6468380.1 alpha/beta hydrolase [Nocardia beijingensis]